MVRASMILAVAGAVACTTPPADPPTAPSAPAAGSDAAPSIARPPPPPDAAAPVPACTGLDERLYGTTCCEAVGGRGDDRFPGMVFLDCTGPQIGKPCHRKTDCDVACSCDRPGLLSNHDGPQGPADGTTGVTGRCNGTLQIGVWMCQLDEHGKVTHVIVD